MEKKEASRSNKKKEIRMATLLSKKLVILTLYACLFIGFMSPHGALIGWPLLGILVGVKDPGCLGRHPGPAPLLDPTGSNKGGVLLQVGLLEVRALGACAWHLG